MKKINKLFLMISLLALPIFAFALSFSSSGTSRCRVIHWQKNHVYTVTGSINMATHIIFPVAAAVDPVVGNRDLWNVESRGNHVFLKPNNASSKDGDETTMTFIGQNNKSYEFILKRVDRKPISCVIISDKGSLLDNSWKHFQTPNQKLITLLSAKLQTDQRIAKDSKQQVVSQQRRTLRDYRSRIYMKYTWKDYGSGWWDGSKNINSVYDDGRWTYIRLNSDAKGVMSIYGYIDGKQELLQYSYDSLNKMYQIAGIYPELVLAYGKSKIDIRRLN